MGLHPIEKSSLALGGCRWSLDMSTPGGAYVRVNYRILVPILLALLSCEQRTEATHVDTTSADTPRVARKPAPVDSAAAPVEAPLPEPTLDCTPANFGPKDTLSLRMNTPHGDYLIATQPGDSLFYVIYPQLNVPTRKYS